MGHKSAEQQRSYGLGRDGGGEMGEGVAES